MKLEGIKMKISEDTRIGILDYLLLRGYPFYGELDLISFLKRSFNLDSMPSTDSRFSNASGDIWKHMVMNSDWDMEYLLYQYLNLLNCHDEQFLKFIQSCVHPLVIRNENIRQETISQFNKLLQQEGYILDKTSEISGKPIYKTFVIGSNGKKINEKEVYEVVLSFAGDNRDYVEGVADYLRLKDVKVFYDKFEEVKMWGKDLLEQFNRIYNGDARYCVIFISEAYAIKAWPNFELKKAVTKAILERKEYILPVKFDDTKLPELHETIMYVDARKKTPEELGIMILQKLGRV